MAYSIYESISKSSSILVNAFVAPIQSSAFHWHSEYEMLGVLKGSITVRIQSQQVELKERDILLINSNMIHAIQSVDGEENLCMIIQMQPNLFELEENGSIQLDFYLDSTDEEIPQCGFMHFYRRMAKVIYETMNEEKHALFRMRAEACCLIADLFDYVVYDTRFRDSRNRSYDELTVAIIEYMEGHLNEDGIVDMVSHEFGLSRKTLDRVLKGTIGMTGKGIIDDLRLERAKQLLKNTDKNMNYILDSCGFGSEKTFYRTFRQETGLTPKEFREKGKIFYENNVLKGYLEFKEEEVKGILRQIIYEK